MDVDVGVSDNMLLCGMHCDCARNRVLGPSAKHGAAEQMFECEVQVIVSSIEEDSGVCKRVQALHDSVVRGQVRRQAAALSASRLRVNSNVIYTATLLGTLIMS